MKVWMASLALGVLAMGSATADTRATQQESLEKISPYLQAPIDEFRFWSLYKWQLMGPDKVVIWSTIKDAYLVSVEQPCSGLEWAHGIGVTSQQRHVVSRRLDSVIFEKQRCRIAEIRPVDVRRMQEDRHAATK